MAVKFALAQLNPTVGDIGANVLRLRRARAEAGKLGADLVITSELYLSAYPPEDLVLKQSFIYKIKAEVEALAIETNDGGPGLLLCAPWVEGGQLYNAALLLDNGEITAKIFKSDLPNYGPFDEKRVFAAAPLPEPVAFRGIKLGVMICEDMWTPDAAVHLEKNGAEIFLVPNGSPYESHKTTQRRELAKARVKSTGLPLIYVNQVGGQDELVFDGNSFAMDKQGNVTVQGASWVEEVIVIQYDKGVISGKNSSFSQSEPNADTYQALVIGLRDYVNKNDFPGVILGMSGGIDSALAAVIAVDALGPEKVWGVMMPSPFTSQTSIEDAAAVMRALGCRLDTIPISGAMNVFDEAIKPIAGDSLKGVAEENIQSRCRGLMLMALSNAKGAMVLATGNKSEMSVGYATLYGDMCGGLAVLKDVYKTEVYKLSHWRNSHKTNICLGPEGEVIPARIFTKAPTAELRPNQKDEDSLPPYETLDGILDCLIEQDLGIHATVAKGFDIATVKLVWNLLDRAEYKRRQAPPGVKITRRSFNRDRRYPITNRYTE